MTGDDRAHTAEDSRAPLLTGEPVRYPREGSALEFDRFAFFSDAVYAIALTLLVVGIAVPTVRDAGDSGEMWDVLLDLRPEFVTFFIGFAVIGRYWLAHHRMCAALGAVTESLMAVNLVYLAFVAFMPFPTALVGRYEENIVAFALFAVVLAIVSFLETVFFVVAKRQGLLRIRVSRSEARRGLVASLLPVAVFLVSIPFAAATNSTVALLSWISIWPLEALLDRLWPARRGT